MLPPFAGDTPTERQNRSPYKESMYELARRFSTTPHRRKLIQGLLDYRSQMMSFVVKGFQWVDGSFVEDPPDREPRDIDVVSWCSVKADAATAFALRTDLWDSTQAKNTYLCDAYVVDLGDPVSTLIQASSYWYGLFSHTRDSYSWKGFLQVAFDPNDDNRAQQVLNER